MAPENRPLRIAMIPSRQGEEVYQCAGEGTAREWIGSGTVPGQRFSAMKYADATELFRVWPINPAARLSSG
jgi:hypothetical protein